MRLKIIVPFAAILAAPGLAGATTLNFSGTVSNGLGSIAVGSTLSGTVTYDETEAPFLVVSAAQTVFNAVVSLDFAIGTFGSTFADATGGPEIQIDDGPAPGVVDRFGVISKAFQGLAPSVLDATYTLTDFAFRVDDTSNSVFGTASSLPAAVDFSDFTSGLFFLFFKDEAGGFFAVDGVIDSVQTVVPLPGAGVLALGAFGLLGAAARRRSA